MLTAGLSGRSYLQVLRRADVQACDVLNPPVDLLHHWVVKRGEPGAERREGEREGKRERDGEKEGERGRVRGGERELSEKEKRDRGR